MKLGTIAQEEAACRAAWKNSKATSAWHCHHETLAETLTEPAENRIDYILYKPANEQALRLRLFRPVKSPSVASARKAYDEAVASARKAYDAATAPARKAYHAAIASAWKAYDEATASARKAYDEAVASAHAKECPDCPWDSRRRTIFA